MRISDVQSSLVAAQQEWQQVLYDPGFVRVDNEIKWAGYSPELQIEPTSDDDVRRLYDRGQYSFVFRDGSIVQIQYRFGPHGGELEYARLAFYRRVESVEEGEETVRISDESELISEIAPPEERTGEVEWLRLEYDPRNAKTLAHPVCHVHIGGLSDVRIGVEGVPTPRQFLEFLVLSFYPAEYAKKRLKSDGGLRQPDVFDRLNSQTFAIKTVAPEVFRFKVPGSLGH